VIKGFLNLPWFAWAAIALIVAVIYSFVWPHKSAADANGFRFYLLRWGHALTWLLLAANFLLRGISPSFNGMANLIATTGALTYVLFLVMAFVLK
jgi:hypothetical protein